MHQLSVISSKAAATFYEHLFPKPAKHSWSLIPALRGLCIYQAISFHSFLKAYLFSGIKDLVVMKLRKNQIMPVQDVLSFMRVTNERMLLPPATLEINTVKSIWKELVLKLLLFFKLSMIKGLVAPKAVGNCWRSCFKREIVNKRLLCSLCPPPTEFHCHPVSEL